MCSDIVLTQIIYIVFKSYSFSHNFSKLYIEETLTGTGRVKIQLLCRLNIWSSIVLHYWHNLDVFAAVTDSFTAYGSAPNAYNELHKSHYHNQAVESSNCHIVLNYIINNYQCRNQKSNLIATVYQKNHCQLIFKQFFFNFR